MQTLTVALILAAVVGAVFLIARRGYWGYPQRLPHPHPYGVEDTYRGNVGYWLFGLGVLAFVGFVFSALCILLYGKEHPVRTIILGSFWVLVVPIYFFLEHTFIFKYWGKPSEYEQFKRLQDQAAKIWAAAILVLAACYFHEFPHVGQ
jgi:hypothetical protein